MAELTCDGPTNIGQISCFYLKTNLSEGEAEKAMTTIKTKAVQLATVWCKSTHNAGFKSLRPNGSSQNGPSMQVNYIAVCQSAPAKLVSAIRNSSHNK